ncbi:MAG: lipopolysaccharide heptosyltransferase II [Candidatus Adiutrix sp.]|jgi:heptosyltransferase-2|nr:lipopolysaccharide heptosyltransferase II [Candidatus Adiutrix sp.]
MKTARSEILVRGANWIGDAVMTLPALAALRDHFPLARLTVLTRPWAAGVYQGQADQVLTYEPSGRHRGLSGILALIRELTPFDLALLFQNAFSAALFPALARVPERWGYARDGRGFLLTRAVRLGPLDRSVHEVFYYLNLLEKLDLPAPYQPPRLILEEAARSEAEALLDQKGLGDDRFLLALAPGAAFGPAKRWPEEGFARAARLILEARPGGAVILGGTEEAPAAGRLMEMLPEPKLDLAGRTTLRTAMAVLSRSALLLTNDSGLMHLGGALGVPLAAVFGPTDPLSTAPLGPSRLIQSRATCAPCRKRVCPLPRQICFDEVSPDLVAAAALELLMEKPKGLAAVFLDPEILGPDPTAAEAALALARRGHLLVLGGPAETSTRSRASLIQAGVPSEALALLPPPGLDLTSSLWIGGRLETMAPANLAGARSVLIPSSREARTGFQTPTLTAPNLKRAVEWFLA